MSWGKNQSAACKVTSGPSYGLLRRGACLALCAGLAAPAHGQATLPPASTTAPAAAPAPAAASATPSPTGHVSSSAARSAYLEGARYLEHDQLDAAERAFSRAVELDPRRPEYGIALQLTREHRVTALVQQAGQARLRGDASKAEQMLREARAIDPQNPLVLEHSAPQVVAAAARPTAANTSTPSNTRRSASTPVLAGAIQLHPSPDPAALHLRGDSHEVLAQIASAYGLRAVMDDSVAHKTLRFDMDSATYGEAMPAAEQMAHVFAVPVDESTVLFANDDAANRQRLEPLLEETIFLPAMTPLQINDIATVTRSIFGIDKASVQSTTGSIVVRAPESVIDPLNATVQQFIDSASEVMLDVKLYEVQMTRNTNIGATLPTQAGIYNVQSEATNLVNNNQALVQQAIAQGYISATASNLQIALALIASGLVQSSLLSSTFGFFGNGLTLTGVTETGSFNFNLGLNETQTRMLDAVQMNIGDRQPATFRSGTKYPIVTSTYTSGISTPASALSNATINGVSVASLLAQYAGGTSETIPQVQYEDLGLTLKATPAIERSGRIFMALDMKIEALSGASLDGNPILNNRQFVSSISVGDGDTAMMVSNLNRSETAAVSGLPGLGELPGFQIPLDDQFEKDTSQLVVLITPHVVRRNMNPFAGPEMIIHVPNSEAAAEPPMPETPPPAPPGMQPAPGSVPQPGATPGTPAPSVAPHQPVTPPAAAPRPDVGLPDALAPTR